MAAILPTEYPMLPSQGVWIPCIWAKVSKSLNQCLTSRTSVGPMGANILLMFLSSLPNQGPKLLAAYSDPTKSLILKLLFMTVDPLCWHTSTICVTNDFSNKPSAPEPFTGEKTPRLSSRKNPGTLWSPHHCEVASVSQSYKTAFKQI